jgi:hypothetical protein
VTSEVVKLPQEALDAWINYDPPEMKLEATRIRYAFMSGFLAASAIEARRVETEGLDAKHESAGPKDDAQGDAA